jgi:hypothetical protein
MAQVSIGQVEYLEDLVRGLLSVREALETSCQEQIAVAESKYEEACAEVENSECMLENAVQQEQAAQQAVETAQQNLASSHSALSSAQSALSSCMAQPKDKDGDSPDCSGEESHVASAEAAVEQAQAELGQAQAELEQAKENRQAMEQRVDLAKQTAAMAQQVLEQTLQECNARLVSVSQAIAVGIARLADAQRALDAYLATNPPAEQFHESVSQAIEVGTARLADAQRALDAYLATNPPAKQFHEWLKWDPAKHGGPITPDILHDRMNLSAEQRRMFQEYLYERDPAYRRQVDRYRVEWKEAKGDAERNIVARKTRTHLSGAFGEQMARHALAPLGGKIETQGRTFVGDGGRYTKTDLIVMDLRAPVILGCGEGMGAPMGGSMAFEVKCGRADYLYAQKDHMAFQAEGHKQADAHCTLCSRDIHDLPPEKERELRDALRDAGSPIVGMLPSKNEIDQSCLGFVHQGEEKQP